MKIEILHPTPKHQVVGEIYDERNSTALYMIDQGYAHRVVDPNENSAAVASAGSTVVNPVPLTWSVVKHAVNGEILVQKKEGFETCLWDKPPRDCPADVAAQWRAMTGNQSLRDKANAAVRVLVDRGR